MQGHLHSGSGQSAVSVIVPCYMTAPWIADALRSVFAQTYRNYEVIVINDGSPDTPLLEQNIAPFIEKIRYIKRPNGGVSAARNTGIRESNAEFIALLDSDDIWKPDYLSTQMRHLLKHPGLDVVYGDLVFFGGSLAGKLYTDLLPSKGEVTFEAIVSGRCNVAASVLARRNAVVAAGLFDESLRICEDLDLWGRLVKRGYRIGYHREPVMFYRQHGESLSSEPVRLRHAMLLVYEKFSRELDLTESERRSIAERCRESLAEILFYEGRNAFTEGDFRKAAAKLSEANRTLRNFKLGLIIAALNLCPRPLRWLHLLRVARGKRVSGLPVENAGT